MFRFNLNLNGKLKTLKFVLDVRQSYYLVLGISPVGLDSENPKQMAQMAEFISRINYGLKNGGFEMDWRDEEIRYRIYVDCADQLPTRKIVRNSIYCLVLTFERYSAGLLDVLFGGVDAKITVARCDQKAEDQLNHLIDSLLVKDADEELEEDREELEDGKEEKPIIKTDLFGAKGGDYPMHVQVKNSNDIALVPLENCLLEERKIFWWRNRPGFVQPFCSADVVPQGRESGKAHLHLSSLPRRRGECEPDELRPPEGGGNRGFGLLYWHGYFHGRYPVGRRPERPPL